MAGPAKFLVTVAEVRGECRPGYKEGDTFELTGLKTPEGGICGAAYHAMFPGLFALNFGARFPFETEDGVSYVACPDKGNVLFKIKKLA